MKQIESFLFAKWPVEVHRRAFRRSVSVYIYPHKPIKVVAAKSTPQKAIVDFLLSKKDWIEKSIAKMEAHANKFPKKKIQSQEKFSFLGRHRDLKVVITLNKKPFFSVTEENMFLHIPRDNWSAESVWAEHPTALKDLRHFYKREAVKHLTERVRHWAQVMDLHPSQVKFREQRTRWGSCSSRRVINLNWRLIVFAPEIIDYVIIHELAHIQHMDHSARFWGLVEKFAPGYEAAIKTLRESHTLTDFLSE